MADQKNDAGQQTRANGRVAFALAGVVVAMGGLAYASVPLYELFCRVTGYGGTTQVAESLPESVGERMVTVRFNADVNPDLPWAFQPVEREVSLRVGESGLAFYRATNTSARRTAGTATFNVTPLKAGQYFNKVQCFCFTEQQLAPGESMDMAVSFFVDPAIEEDPNLAEVKTITLSYTFFPDLDAAVEEPLASLSRTEEDSEQGSVVN
ncbi:cytochrome c oxidase assembly protein [Pelagibius litoralis]|uniref:Cytochrome c oxidase assembly protein CtaG n=1 Tax=Pelagibius litoralis TaxID=374515 RepID=A0A967KIE4_9PROT|nr:cytochrome c oxidase assembly protein [Pelagibius litoralis]NIA72196.1 cytochrome c oxidase assembly protein [Pelagibius litoralis]